MLNDSIQKAELHEQFGNLRIDQRIKPKWHGGAFASCGEFELVQEKELSVEIGFGN